MSNPSFPFVYKCAECGLEMTVTRSEAKELNPTPDMFAAMAVLLRRRGWTRSPEKNALYCPGCTTK